MAITHIAFKTVVFISIYFLKLELIFSIDAAK